MTDLQRRAVELVQTLGHEKREIPFKLASGESSKNYVDGKRAVATGKNLTAGARRARRGHRL